MVGVRGFEPPTPCTPCKCATRLRHTPNGLHYSGGISLGQAWRSFNLHGALACISLYKRNELGIDTATENFDDAV